MYGVFLAFYAGICYEFLGQSAHLYSNNKVTHLHAALGYFLDCFATIPQFIPLPKLPMVYPTPHPSPDIAAQSPLSPLTPETCFEISFDSTDRSPLLPVPFDTLTRMIENSLQNQNRNQDSPFVPNAKDKYKTSFVQACLAAVAAPEGSLRNNDLFRIRVRQTSDSDKEENTSDKDENGFESDSLMPSPLHVRKVSPRGLIQRARGYHTLYDTPTKPKVNYAPRPFGETKASQLNIDSSKLSMLKASKRAGTVSSPSRLPVPAKKGAQKGNGHEDDDCRRDLKIVRNETFSPAHMAQIVKFNRGVELLRSLVKTNIADIRKHVAKVIEIQEARRARRISRVASFWSFSPITPPEESDVERQPEPEVTVNHFGNVLTKETKEQRIRRLRAEGWNTVGLRSPCNTWKGARYYQEFCGMVLNELYVDNEVV